MRYKKPEAAHIRGICVKCGKYPQILRSKGSYRALCSICHKERCNTKRRGYRNYKKNKCASCGFVAIHPCQLDVDHIDGNHQNSEPSNLQTLCANCHRLKTYIAKDYLINH